MASSVSYASSSSYCGSSSSPSSYTNLSDEFDGDVVVIKPPPPPVPRPSRRKTPVALANASAATAAAVSAAAAVAAASTAKRNKNAQTEEGQASKKRGKQQSHQEVQPKDEARKARNRASAERSRQRRLMYTASLEGKLASAEEKSRILENRNILLEEMIRAIASGQMKAEDALTKMQSMTPIPAKPINNDDDMFAGGAPAVTAEPLPLDLDIFDSKMDVGENEVEGKAVKATRSTKPSCNGNNDNTLAQVISGSVIGDPDANCISDVVDYNEGDDSRSDIVYPNPILEDDFASFDEEEFVNWNIELESETANNRQSKRARNEY